MSDTYDLLTLAEGKTAVNVDTTDTTYDTELAQIITGVSQRIVDLCGPIVNATFTNETYNGGDTTVTLRNAAIGANATTTITSAAEYNVAGTSTTLSVETFNVKPADGLVVEPETGIIHRRRAGWGWYFWPGIRNVVFTYTSGRAANTAAVPPKFKNAAMIMVAHLWRQRGPQAGAFRNEDGSPAFGVAAFSVPKAVVELLAREIRPDRRLGIG